MKNLPTIRTPDDPAEHRVENVTRENPHRPRGRLQDTIIVGAGLAGLAAARRLHDAKRPFLVISENVAGRVQRSRDGAVNLGAYYVRDDYTNVKRYVELGRRIDTLAMRHHDVDGSYTYWDRRLLFHLPQAARFLHLLSEFRRRYEVLKANSLVMSQAQAIRSDPLLLRLYHQPATHFIQEHRLGDAARSYLAPGLHGTTFLPLSHITAFALLLGALPVLVPIYEFTLLQHRLVAGFRDAIITDTVTRVALHGTRYQVDTRTNATFTAARVVIAAPIEVSKQLLGLQSTKRSASAHMFQVIGTLRNQYDHAHINLFPDDEPTLAIAPQANGSILFCSRERDPDFDRYLTTWRIVEHKHWNPAFHLVGDQLLECELSPNLYLIGDHNVCGLEDTYLTGLFAANQIIADTHGATTVTQSRPHRECPPEILTAR